MLEPTLFRRGDDLGKVRPSHGSIYISGRPRLVRLTIIHVKERCHSTNDSVRETRGIHGGMKPAHSLEQLVHV
jgi:hypothetical protein